MVEVKDSKILRRGAERLYAGGVWPRGGSAEHRWGVLCWGVRWGREGVADRWEWVEAAFKQRQPSQRRGRQVSS